MNVLRDFLVQLGYATVTALLMCAVVVAGWVACRLWDRWLVRCADRRQLEENTARRQALGRVSAPSWERGR